MNARLNAGHLKAASATVLFKGCLSGETRFESKAYTCGESPDLERGLGAMGNFKTQIKCNPFGRPAGTSMFDVGWGMRADGLVDEDGCWVRCRALEAASTKVLCKGGLLGETMFESKTYTFGESPYLEMGLGAVALVMVDKDLGVPSTGSRPTGHVRLALEVRMHDGLVQGLSVWCKHLSESP